MSKAALNMPTRLLAFDLKPYNITTITVHPGWMRTKMGGANAVLSPAESARGILELTYHLTAEQNGGFYKWTGEAHSW
jgi:NAD(P)-dependent dehydrogenase (short-subunit alcohol dehydrogenase family)